ncbi:MAG TPA: porin PorA family protein [Patescibacteria group bacterium]|nr:porin PorA family protein [Patescibacteria group bacterium]
MYIETRVELTKDDIIRVTVIGNVNASTVIETQKKTQSLINNLKSKNKPSLILVDLSQTLKEDSGARNAAKKFLNMKFDRIAIFGATKPLGKTVIYLIRSAGILKHAKYFKSEKNALLWLKTGKSTSSPSFKRTITLISLSLFLTLIALFWHKTITPYLLSIPKNFNYNADIISYDNFYNPDLKQYGGESLSQTKYSYQSVGSHGNILTIKNIFDVRKVSGERIFSVERTYAVNKINGRHEYSKFADENRSGYLFAPKNLHKQPFTYWHINYDIPARMYFKDEEIIYGLKVYRYESNFHADQTKNLTNLPGVGQSRGINLDINLQLWVEPLTGHLIKYEDHSLAYYYDLKTKSRIYPWNKFHNQFTLSSINSHVRIAEQARQKTLLIQTVIPLILIILAAILLLSIFIPALLSSNLYILLPIVLLIASIYGTYKTTTFVNDRGHTQALNFLDTQTNVAQNTIQNQLTSDANVLYGAKGFIQSNPTANRNQWANFVNSLGLAQNYPGVQALGYAKVVTDSQKISYINSVRSEGFPSFSIWPDKSSTKYIPVTFIEPFDTRNKRAFGYDLISEPIRRIAVETATNTGNPTMTGKIKLVQETKQDVQPGFLIILPIYNPNLPNITSSDRQSAVIGYVYEAFRANNFMQAALGQQISGINLQIYDDSIIKPNSLIYKTSNILPNPYFKEDKVLSSAQHNWTIKYSNQAGFDQTPGQTLLADIILVIGLILSAAIASSIYLISSSRHQAVELAERITEDLLHSENQFRVVVDAAPDGIIVVNEQGEIEQLNHQISILFGYEEAELIGYKIEKLIPNKYITKLVNNKSFKSKSQNIKTSSEGLEFVAKHKNGSEFPIELSLSPIKEVDNTRIIVIIHNITFRKQTEKALAMRASEIASANAKDEALIVGIGEGLIVLNNEGKIERLNKTGSDILGYSESELLGKNFASSVKALTYDKKTPIKEEQRSLYKALDVGKVINAYCYYLKKDGTPVAVQLNVSPVKLNNKITGAIEVFRDVSYEKQLDQAKDDFLALASHQLQTPATAVKQYLGLLLDNYFGKVDKKQKDIVEKAYQYNDEQIKIIQDLLDVARIESGRSILNLNKFNLKKLIEGVVETQQKSSTHKNLKINLNVDSKLAVIADEVKIKMCMNNLINNAIKFSPDRGEIIVRVEVTPKFVNIYVIDNGPGIAKNQISKLFSRFSRINQPTQSHISGTGIGLYISKQVIEMHGGELTATTQLGKGTTFKVQLPKISKLPKKQE